MHLYSFTLPQQHRELLSEILAEKILTTRIKDPRSPQIDEMQFMQKYLSKPDNLLVVLYNEEDHSDPFKNFREPTAWRTTHPA